MTRHPVLFLLCLLLAAPASAKDEREARGDRNRPLRESVREIERDTGGEVLRAERVPQNGRDVNRIKVITPEGRVRVYRDAARSGENKSGKGREEGKKKGKDKDD